MTVHAVQQDETSPGAPGAWRNGPAPAEFGGGTAELRRHPRYGRGLAAPMWMPSMAHQALRHIVVVLTPQVLMPTDAEARERTITETEEQVRRLMAYMPRLTAFGLMFLLWFVNQAPRWTFRSVRRLGTMPLDDARQLLKDLSGSRISAIRTMLYAVRGVIHAVIYDSDAAWREIDYKPHGWMNSRIAMRRELLAGRKPTAAEMIVPVAAVLPAPELTLAELPYPVTAEMLALLPPAGDVPSPTSPQLAVPQTPNAQTPVVQLSAPQTPAAQQPASPVLPQEVA